MADDPGLAAGRGSDASAAPPEPEPGYEKARDELLRIVATLESGGLTLEQSLALWERGEYLADVCDRWLDGAQRRLDAARRSDA